MLEIALIVLCILALCGVVSAKALAIVTLVYLGVKIALDIIKHCIE